MTIPSVRYVELTASVVLKPSQEPNESGYLICAISTIAAKALVEASPLNRSTNSDAVKIKDKSVINPVAASLSTSGSQPLRLANMVAAAASSSSSDISESQKESR